MKLTTRRLHSRRAALAAPLALALSAAGIVHSARAATTPPPCTTSQLVPSIGSGNGTAGTTFFTLSFANVGSRCTLRGYPGVQAVARNGSSLGNASRIAGTKVSTITVKAAGVATFPRVKATLGIVDFGALPKCKPQAAVALKITPPNQTTSKTVPFAFEACAHGPSVLNIRPVTG
jgi:hypothetical protein